MPHLTYSLRVLLASAVAVATAFAQDKPAAKAFEVVSIKPADPNNRGIGIEMTPGGRFTASGITLQILLQQAYGIRNFQIVNAPGWSGSDRYVISAKAEDGTRQPTQKDIQQMMRGVLADRFGLTFHRETKDGSVYFLVLAKGGPKLKETEAAGRDQQQQRLGRGQINVQGGTMDALCNQLGNQLGRPVLDKTGLTGQYDFKLEWTPDAGGQVAIRGTADEEPPADPSGPTIFTALQEQLGLKLDSGKGPVEYFVIDKVEKPTEN